MAVDRVPYIVADVKHACMQEKFTKSVNFKSVIITDLFEYFNSKIASFTLYSIEKRIFYRS